MHTSYFDRTIAPNIQPLEAFDFAKSTSIKLSNGVPVHSLASGSTDAVRIEFVFNAGNTAEEIPGVASLASKMLQEGTSNHTAKQLAEALAHKGAFLEIQSGYDHTTIIITCLYKFLPDIITLADDMIAHSKFPDEHFDTVKDIAAQQWKINMEKTAFVASGLIRKQIFGELHPYGTFLSWDQLQEIENKNCFSFYKNQIKNAIPEIFIAGGTQLDLISDIEKTFAPKILFERGKQPIMPEMLGLMHNALIIEKKDSVQSSIRLGKKLFTRKHPDYMHFKVLNEILGGYFGSRLMKNIREDKGLTYGIFSQIVQLRHAGYLVIGTDVNKENTRLALDEIRKEIQILRKEPVPKAELETVKNYMIGTHLGSLTHAMSLMDKFKAIYFAGITYDFYDHYVQSIKNTTPEHVMEMAQKYLDPDTLLEVVVGGK